LNWVKYLPAFIRQGMEGRSYLKRVLKNTSWLFFDNILRMGVGLIVGVWLARYLGPGKYGQLNYSLAFVAVFSSLANLGLNNIVIRNVVNDPTLKNEILGTTFVLKLFGGLLAFGITVASIFLLHPDDTSTNVIVAIIAAGLLFQAFDAIDLWYQSQIQSKIPVIARTMVIVTVNMIKIVLIVLKAPLIAFVWASLAEIVLGSAGLLTAFKINGQHLRSWFATSSMAKKLIKDSWPLTVASLSGMVYLRIDQVMLGEMKGNEEVGIYSVAVRLAEVWYFIPMAIVSSVLPGIVEAKAVSEQLFYDRLQRFYNIMAFIGYLIALPMTFFAGWLVNYLFGPEYARAGSMLMVLIWAGIFVNIGVARSAFLTSMNWTRAYLMTEVMGCTVNIVLNLALIPRYGGMGAVIASCVAYWVAAHGACFLYRPLHKTGFMLTRAMLFPKFW